MHMQAIGNSKSFLITLDLYDRVFNDWMRRAVMSVLDCYVRSQRTRDVLYEHFIFCEYSGCYLIFDAFECSQ
jgi:hypothetical protein